MRHFSIIWGIRFGGSSSEICMVVSAFMISWYYNSHRSKGEVIRATFFFKLQRDIAGLQVEKHCCPHYHTPQTLSRNKISLLHWSWSSIFQQVELASTIFNTFFQLARKNICCVAMFEVGGDTCNNAFKLATQQINVACKLKKNVARITGP